MILTMLRHGLGRLAATVLLAAMPAISAGAGDFAERAFLGFSADGRYFAFEQFGIQDGSGFPYSDIFVIDLEADAWVEGTPVRVSIENEEVPISEARRQAHDKVRPTLEQFDVYHPGRLVAAAPVTEAYQDPHELSFRRHSFEAPGSDQRTALLDILDRPTPPGCAGLGEDFKGFALRVRNDATKEEILVHEDAGLPSSRGCPLDYGLSDIVAFPAFAQAEILVLLVNVFAYGFEGPDRRYIAIRIPAP
jgi:predicted secreted protein